MNTNRAIPMTQDEFTRYNELVSTLETDNPQRVCVANGEVIIGDTTYILCSGSYHNVAELGAWAFICYLVE